MLKPLALLTVLFSLLLAAPAGAVIVPGKGMAGVKLGQCIKDVVAVIGEPDRTFGKTEPTGEFVESYKYDKLSIIIRFYHGPGECACRALDVAVTKSTATHHFKVLREAGIIQQRQQGTARLNSLRDADLEARFPGLLASILAAA